MQSLNRGSGRRLERWGAVKVSCPEPSRWRSRRNYPPRKKMVHWMGCYIGTSEFISNNWCYCFQVWKAKGDWSWGVAVGFRQRKILVWFEFRFRCQRRPWWYRGSNSTISSTGAFVLRQDPLSQPIQISSNEVVEPSDGASVQCGS